MVQNTLFNYISYSSNLDRNNNTKRSSFELKSNTKGAAYYLKQLEKDMIKICDYTLLEHHISVYEKENNFLFGQHHYTAVFEDETGINYKLHVYFDANDSLTADPVFSIYNKQTQKYERIDASVPYDDFTLLAQSYIEPIMSELREKQKQTIQLLEQKYKQLEKNACSISETPGNNRSKFLASLTKIQEVLANIIPLVKHNHYEPINQFISNLKKNVEQTPDTPSSEQMKKPKENSVNSSKNTHNKHTLFQKSRSKTTKSQKDILYFAFDKEFSAISNTFSGLNDNNDESKSKILADLYARSNGLLISAEIETVDFSALKKLKSLNGQIQKAGEEQLRTVLKNGDFSSAQHLSAFHYLLTGNYLNEALQSRNHALLNFLLSTGNFSINNQPLNINTIRYPSAVHYCFSYDSKKKPMAECLDVLIKNGASLHVMVGEAHVPLAHILLSTADHPLMKALDSNRVLTLNSISFYKRLMRDLEHYRKINQLDESQSQQLDTWFINYAEAIKKIELMPDCSKPIGKNLDEKQVAYSEKIAGTHIGQFIKQLQTDPEIKSLSSTFLNNFNNYMSTLAHSQKTQVALNGMKILENMEGALLAACNTELLTFELVRHASITYLKDSINMVENRRLLSEIQEQLRVQRPGRAQKKMATQQKELIDKLQNYTNTYHQPALFNDVSYTAALQTVGQAIQGIVELAQGMHELAEQANALQQRISNRRRTELLTDESDAPVAIDTIPMGDLFDTTELGIAIKNLTTVSNLFTMFQSPKKSNRSERNEDNDDEKVPEVKNFM